MKRGGVIPSRFLVPCTFCGDPLDLRAEGVYRRARGWVKNRTGGGVHALALPEREDQWACTWCVEGRPKVRPWTQEQLPL